MTFDLLKPYLIRSGALDEVIFDELYQHMLMEMIHEDLPPYLSGYLSGA